MDGGMAGRDSFVLALVDRKLGISVVVTMLSLLLVIRVQNMNWALVLAVNLFAAVCLLRLAVALLRLPALRALYSCQPWASAPWTVPAAAWEIAVGLLVPKHGRAVFFSFCLPPLPLPSLQDTLSRHVASLEGLLPANEFARVQQCADKLRARDGAVLQRALQEGARGTTHGWLAPWERRRLASQESNAAGRYYLLDGVRVPAEASGQQATRAASLVAGLLEFRSMVRRREVPARGFMKRFTDLPKSVPRCMWVYETLFNTSLVPCETGYRVVTRSWKECDEFILIFCRGQAYTIEVDASAVVLKEQFDRVLALSKRDARKPKGPLCVESVSRLRRDQAAIARRVIESSEDTANLLETASFTVSLDVCDCQNFSQQAFLAITGDSAQEHPGSGRWLESPFTLVVSPNGRASLACVAPMAERSAASHMWEFALAQEVYPLQGVAISSECLF
mmetsp:Transcript_3173/g.7954  ORF Transcript_3173/g.7954 Transcript_3173/m.7954 type:complete len:450 (-) Transcript_3173:911-2260(-)